LVAAALLAAGCGDVSTDTAIFVEPGVLSPSVAVSAGALGTNLTGAFQLTLHLGENASGTSQVTPEAFSLTNADETVVLVSPLPAAPTDPSRQAPFEVRPGSDVVVGYAFDTGADPLPADVGDAICGAGALRITGVIRDSLENKATPAASQTFTPAGCP
jgi:hypothetical protein